MAFLTVYVEESENVNNRRSQKYTTFLCKTVNLQHNISYVGTGKIWHSQALSIIFIYNKEVISVWMSDHNS